MIWPIGQQSGDNLETAILSRAIWMDLAPKAKFWLRPNGSLHLAYHPLEKAVIEEFLDNSQDALYNIEWVDSDKAQELAKGLNPGNLLGALWSKTECLVNPREALLKITAFLEEKFNVDFFSTPLLMKLKKAKFMERINTGPVIILLYVPGRSSVTSFPKHLKPSLLKGVNFK
ncbi:MAG: FAD-dependent oxidoreductase [Saprospiraceae bacterium]